MDGIRVGSIKYQLTADGSVGVSKFDYFNDESDYPSWFWSFTLRGERAQAVIRKYNLNDDNKSFIDNR